MVLEPLTTASPASTSMSASLELRVCAMLAELDCEAPRISATDAGGLGRSVPSNWKAGSARHTRTYALLLGCRSFTVPINWLTVRGEAVRIWRKSARLVVAASATVK